VSLPENEAAGVGVDGIADVQMPSPCRCTGKDRFESQSAGNTIRSCYTLLTATALPNGTEARWSRRSTTRRKYGHWQTSEQISSTITNGTFR
jgi:hypothetical protein